jgi:gliding motility-associated-like protein
MKKLICILFFVGFTIHSFAQLDTLFWFVAPEVAQTHGDRPIVFRFASLGSPAVITISQPSNPTFPIQVINLAANSAQTVDLTTWIDIIENKPANSVLNFGFKITSTAPITAYYEVTPTCNCNPDIFSLKGKNSLGTSFITPFQNFLNNASYARSAFNIVATENNTTVTIIPTQDIVGHAANIPFTVTLNEGQTFCSEALNTAANLHLSGSVIISDKPVAITLSDDTAQGTPYGGCADLMGDQLIPTNVIGKEYIAIKGYLNGPDKLYIVGVTNGTQINIDGNFVATINASQTYVHTLSNPSVYIETSEPAYLLHQSGFGCEVGEAILPPIVCTGSNTVAFVRSTNEFFAINLLVPSGGEGQFLFNGVPGIINASSFNFVPGTANSWMYAQIDASGLLAALQSARIENPNYKFHMGLIHGGASSGCRYGYFSDFASLSYEIQVNDESFCVGDTINLSTINLPGATYEWAGPAGFSAVGDSISIQNVQINNSGQYIISGNLPGACELLADSIQISVIDVPPTPQIFSNGPVCEGEVLQFWNDVELPFVYTWIDDQGNILPVLDTISITTNTTGQVGINVLSSLGECISTPTTFETSVLELPTINYIGPDSVCGNQVNLEATIFTDPQDPFSSVEWFNAINQTSIGNGILLNNINSTIEPSNQDTYYVTITTLNGCIASDTFNVQFNPIPNASIMWDDLCDGASIDFTNSSSWIGNPGSNDDLTFQLNFGDGQQSSNPDATHLYPEPGQYNVTLIATSNANCVDTADLPITVFAIPEPTITIDDGCGKVAFEVSVNTGNNNIDSLVWSIANQFQSNAYTFSTLFSEGGEYQGTLTLYTTNNCEFETPFNFEVIPSISIENLELPNIITANKDGKNDEFIVHPLFSNCNEYSIDILNRWGLMVYQMTNSSQPFEGKDMNGEELLPGVYFYVFKSNENIKHGTITIVR